MKNAQIWTTQQLIQLSQSLGNACGTAPQSASQTHQLWTTAQRLTLGTAQI
ncbi:hypothetical protein IQ241_03485 [Romeria aff. gracilis LEGE 07310]|uniref:Uncharacterized protein n=1 Tax=Vasconcelosia minhoensis LEGE 07310 TaxID=915328 RepID=A0A8J7AJ63_9CYAN|nr:hypothetical protein [Romeria gracilis]MBE9076365.1 hypothetical protein [Romeria aff. gracilis LEGE 07310]